MIIIFQYELDLEKYLCDNINLVEENMLFVSNQVRIQSRRLDILSLDNNQYLCGIELKNKKPNQGTIKQCEYYINNCLPLKRLLLIAPDYSDKIANQLKLLNKVELKIYYYENNKIIIKDFVSNPTKKIKVKVAKEKIKDNLQLNHFSNSSDSLKNFAKRLRCLRESKGINQNELSHVLGIPRPSIANYESEKNNRLPRNDRLIAIAKYFDVSISYLLEG
ncbi:hypothetical protein GCM10023310_70270 [Paenibacillus vulneris]|uniref:Endonuclease NucS domain-containing protein n=1 Tax=Paenibacillus vulneris TaxID=1133364 RepID=A0ABW3UGI9_9BACL